MIRRVASSPCLLPDSGPWRSVNSGRSLHGKVVGLRILCEGICVDDLVEYDVRKRLIDNDR